MAEMLKLYESQFYSTKNLKKYHKAVSVLSFLVKFKHITTTLKYTKNFEKTSSRLKPKLQNFYQQQLLNISL